MTGLYCTFSYDGIPDIQVLSIIDVYATQAHGMHSIKHTLLPSFGWNANDNAYSKLLHREVWNVVHKMIIIIIDLYYNTF